MLAQAAESWKGGWEQQNYILPLPKNRLFWPSMSSIGLGQWSIFFGEGMYSYGVLVS